MFSVDIAKLLRIAFLYKNSGGCFWQSYHGTLKSAWVPLLWFHTSTWFQFWSKLSQNVAQVILHYHVTKQFLPCLNWLVTFWKNINCFRFSWKTYTNRCTSNYVISRVKRLSLWLVRCFQNQGIIWKTEECRVIKNIALKTWRWKSQFWCCSAFAYFADLKTIYFACCLCCSCMLF